MSDFLESCQHRAQAVVPSRSTLSEAARLQRGDFADLGSQIDGIANAEDRSEAQRKYAKRFRPGESAAARWSRLEREKIAGGKPKVRQVTDRVYQGQPIVDQIQQMFDSYRLLTGSPPKAMAVGRAIWDKLPREAERMALGGLPRSNPVATVGSLLGVRVSRDLSLGDWEVCIELAERENLAP